MPGPPPNPLARRRNARPEWRKLPAAGRSGEPPAWPLTHEPDPRAARAEKQLWAQLWTSPQAIAWEALGWARVVARYTRVVVAAEQPDASASILAEARQMEDRLGLNPMSMKRLQWELDGDVTPEPAHVDVPNIDDYRERLG